MSVTVVVGVLSATFSGCNKDDNGMLEVFAESFGSNAKLVVNNRIAEWQDGDKLRINDTTAIISRQSNGHAYIPSSVASSANRAVFPASLCSSITGDNITITLPSEYLYRTSGGLQVLEVPMAAASAEDSPLHFRHLTGALNIRIQGRSECSLLLESVTITSDKYQLSGSCPLNFADIDGQTAHTATTDEQKSVTLKFDGTELLANSSLDVTIPVPPVLSDNHFTINVKARHNGTRYVYTRIQESGGALGRNIMGYSLSELDNARKAYLFDGDGSNTSYYNISSKDDFLLMVEAINNDYMNHVNLKYKEAFYRLTNDIDMAGTTIIPITNFTSGTTFDGNEKKVKNLTITSTLKQSSTYVCGLFTTPNAIIKNLILDSVVLQHTGSAGTLYLSPLCTIIESPCTIDNCEIKNVNVNFLGSASSTYYGTLAASTPNNINVSNCIVSGNLTGLDVSGPVYYGGILGEVASNCTANISNCTIEFTDTLNIHSSGSLYFGGIVGSISSSRVYINNTNWHGNVSVNSGGLYAGGGVGSFATGTNGALYIQSSNLSGSLNTEISGSTLYVGCFLGRKNGSRTTDFTGSTASLSHNGSPVNKDIGNQ